MEKGRIPEQPGLGKVLQEGEALGRAGCQMTRALQLVRAGQRGTDTRNPVLHFEGVSGVTALCRVLVRAQKDLLQSQQGHKQLTEVLQGAPSTKQRKLRYFSAKMSWCSSNYVWTRLKVTSPSG